MVTVDTLVTNGLVVTMDPEGTLFDNGFIAIKQGRIVALGEAARAGDYRAAETVDARGRAVLPGLVNTHTHVAMTLFRGLADDLELQDWLMNHIFPAEARNLSPEFVAAGTRLGLVEMIRGGTTTFVDMYLFEDSVAQETHKSGMRAVLSQVMFDFPAADAASWEERLELIERLVADWKDHPLITPSIGPHAPYTVGAEHLKECRRVADRHQVPLHIHVAETRREVDQVLEEHGKTPVAYLDALGVLGSDTIAAHLVHLNSEDIRILAERGVGAAHCPESNMKLASGVAPIPAMLEAGVKIGLGPDGTASNNNLSMWDEMDAAAKLHKVVALDARVVPARTALEMGTIRGARVAGLADQIGSLEEGKQADLIMVDLTAAHLTPRYDIYSHLVYATQSSDVTDVMVAGRLLMRDRCLTTLDEEAVKTEAWSYTEQVLASQGAG